jgi:hypothetical protein
MRATDGIFRSLILRAGCKGWPVSAIVAGSILFVAALGLFVFMRRATGALTAPLATPQLVATAVVMCLWALVVREFTAKRAAYFWLSIGTMLLVAIGCSFPVARVVDWLVWLPAIGCVAMLPLAPRMQLPISRRPSSPAADSDADQEHERVLQQLTRFRTADGKDAIRGTVVAEFMVGERQTTVYIGFCPPFVLSPRVEVNVSDDLEAEVKLAQVLHNGAQLEVRLSEPAEEVLAVSIEFFASEGL